VVGPVILFICYHLFTSHQGGFQQTAEQMIVLLPALQRLLPLTLIDTHHPLTRRPNLVVQRTDICLPLPHDGVRPICSGTCMSSYMQSFHSTSLIIR